MKKREPKRSSRQMLRHIDGDVPMCLGKKERTTKEKKKEVSRSEVSRHTSNQDEGTLKEKKGVRSSSSKGRNPTSTKEGSKDVTFIVIQKNTRSMNSSVWIDEMFSELQGCRWDAILASETWRPKEEEIWESEQGHNIMCAGKFENKHGVAIEVNKKWKRKINWTNYISKRAIATSVTVNTQRITLTSVYMPHSGYADHHVEKAYNMIEKVIKPTTHMLIFGGGFDAELGPGIGIERTSVRQHTHTQRGEQKR